jgi:hypothetical protein
MLRAQLALAPIVLLSVVVLRAQAGSGAPRMSEAVGPARCVRCHIDEARWWTQTDGPPPRGHVNALTQLESPQARRYVQRTGASDVYDARSGCVTCHATMVRGMAQEGVSCESCHGAGSGYLQVHAQPGAYRLAVGAGMEDVVGQVNVWGRRCLECHLVKDQKLVAAGHSSGRAFDLGQKYELVAVHWKRRYSAEAVTAAGREIALSMRARADR